MAMANYRLNVLTWKTRLSKRKNEYYWNLCHPSFFSWIAFEFPPWREWLWLSFSMAYSLQFTSCSWLVTDIFGKGPTKNVFKAKLCSGFFLQDIGNLKGSFSTKLYSFATGFTNFNEFHGMRFSERGREDAIEGITPLFPIYWTKLNSHCLFLGPPSKDVTMKDFLATFPMSSIANYSP